MNTKRYCPRNHDTSIVGRKNSNGRCNECEKEDHDEFHLMRIGNPIKRMLKNTKQRIRYRENLLKDENI